MTTSENNNVLTEFDDGLIRLLKSDVTDLKTVKPFEGEIADALEEVLRERMPAAFTIYTGSRIERTDENLRVRLAEWVIIIAARSLRSKEDAARGRAGKLGAYDLLQRVTSAIDGARIPDDKAMPLEVTGELLADTPGAEHAVYQVTVSAEHAEDC